jgi:enoyl-CoA hydratase/carnithine racemase
LCGGYDLVESAEGMGGGGLSAANSPPGSPLDPMVVATNHDPSGTWDPMVDYATDEPQRPRLHVLFNCAKPVVCKVHGFCVAGGTDMALCSDLLVIAADAKIGYPPARVWGSPTTMLWAQRMGAQRAKRLLFLLLANILGLADWLGSTYEACDFRQRPIRRRLQTSVYWRALGAGLILVAVLTPAISFCGFLR